MVEPDKIIYTDAERTKDNLWEAYNGFKYHYNAYIMYKQSLHKTVLEHTAGMNKYARYFYDEAFDFFKDFEKELDLIDIEKFKAIMKNYNHSPEDYDFIRIFTAKFMKKTGIRNISRDKDNINESVKKNR